MEQNNKDFTKDFFQTAWGESGYYEDFSFGVGIDKVFATCMTPFIKKEFNILEIGCGGGAFTKRVYAMQPNHLVAIDVIKQPAQFDAWNNFTFYELPNQDFTCSPLADNTFDFAYSYNVFCHLSNEALKTYLHNICRVLKPGSDFVFMISNFENVKQYFADIADTYDRKDNHELPNGHFHQDLQTIHEIADFNEWELINPNMLPEHRDIAIHLKKK